MAIRKTRRTADKKEPKPIVGEGENLLDIVSDIAEEDYEILRDVVCPFYKSGKATKCYGCKRDEENVIECKDLLIDGLIKRPVYGLAGAKYTEEFDLDIAHSREKEDVTKFAEAPSLGLVCNTCHVSDSCPKFKRNYVCGVDWTEGVDLTDPKAMIDHLIGIQAVRVNRAKTWELADGGMPDQTTSTELDRLVGLINTKDAYGQSKFSMNITASGEGTKQGESLLAKLFAQPAATEALPQHDNTLDVEFTEEVLEPKKLKKNEKQQ